MSPSIKKIFAGIFIIILMGAAVVYYVARREEEINQPAPTDTLSITDSAVYVNPVTAIEAKPEVDAKDGSVKIVEAFVKANAKNPSTVEFLEWSELSAEGAYWKVRCKYVGVSSFNAEVTTNAWFYIQHNQVVYTKIISKI